MQTGTTQTDTLVFYVAQASSSIVTVKVPRAKLYIKLHAHSKTCIKIRKYFQQLKSSNDINNWIKDVINYYNVMITQLQRAVQEYHCLCNDGVSVHRVSIHLTKCDSTKISNIIVYWFISVYPNNILHLLNEVTKTIFMHIDLLKHRNSVHLLSCFIHVVIVKYMSDVTD